MNLDLLINDLKKSKEKEDFKLFVKILKDISILKDASCIKKLVFLLEDNYDFEEELFSIVPLIESFPFDIYIRELIDVIPELCTSSPYWTETLLIRIKNNSDASKVFRTILSKNKRKLLIEEFLKKFNLKF